MIYRLLLKTIIMYKQFRFYLIERLLFSVLICIGGILVLIYYVPDVYTFNIIVTMFYSILGCILGNRVWFYLDCIGQVRYIELGVLSSIDGDRDIFKLDERYIERREIVWLGMFSYDVVDSVKVVYIRCNDKYVVMRRQLF